MSSRPLGIDFGTTGCKVATLDEYGRARCLPNAEGEEVTPTVVAFEGKEKPVIGREAYRLALSHPQDTLMDVKLRLGSPEILYTTASGNTYTAVELTALVLGKLKQDSEQILGEKAERVVITCPANFQDDARSALSRAAEKAGFKVEKLISEPAAAAMAYGLQRGTSQMILVFDLGGGTFDVSVARCQGDQIEILGTSGVPRLGGRDFDKCIADYMLPLLAKQLGFRPDEQKDVVFYEDLRERVELAKHTLSVREETKITIGARGKYGTGELTRKKFDELIHAPIDLAVKTCSDLLELLGKTWKDIDKLVLVGGGSKVPAVKAAIEKASGLRASQDIDPIRAVSFGAAIQAAVESARGTGTYILDGRAIPAPRTVLKDVTAYAVGIKVDDANLGMSQAVIVPRHSPIPGKYSYCFRLKHADQTHAEIVLLEGNEGEPADRCLILGSMELKDLPADPSLPQRIQVTVEMDGNGRISAQATDTISGKTVQMQIDYARGMTKAA